MFGLLNINKPLRLTSRDVVNRVCKRVHPIKVGHAGTLDPLASGVLVVCVGHATRLVSYIQDESKTYVGTFVLGKRSDTEDCEGVVEDVPVRDIPREELEAILPRFTGRIRQRPSQFSAIRVGGQRAYERARKGQVVEVPERDVEIHALRCVEYDFPTFRLEVECGSGTYMRSLGRDIGLALGTHALMVGLERTRIGDFRIDDALSIEDLSAEVIAAHLRSPLEALGRFPQVMLSSHDVAQLRMGRCLRHDCLLYAPPVEVVGVHAGEAVSLLRVHNNQLVPVMVF